MKREIDLEDILRTIVANNDFGILTMPICIEAMRVACDVTVDECVFNLMNDKEWHNAFELNKQIKNVQKTKDQIRY